MAIDIHKISTHGNTIRYDENRRHVMTSHDHIKLTASELSNFFMSYLQDEVAVCVLSYFLEHVEDPDIRACVEYAKELSEMHVDNDRKLFNAEGMATPVG